MAETLLDTRQKALAINLDPSSYGSFAEIGGGQEVAREGHSPESRASALDCPLRSGDS